VHKLRLDADVQLPLVAGAVRGFSGAELAALCNEAAIRAARRKSSIINMSDFTSARAFSTSSWAWRERASWSVDASRRLRNQQSG
jgi:ATP-dependent 26S proteasome regulatory subunit